MRPRFEEPQPHEEPKPLEHCTCCKEELYNGEQVYMILDETLCENCVGEYVRAEFGIWLDEEDYR